MLFVKSESKTKNWITSFTLAPLFTVVVMLDGKLNSADTMQDCDCGLSYVALSQTQQHEAGWFWGNPCKNGVRVYRVLGITVKRNRGCCYKE